MQQNTNRQDNPELEEAKKLKQSWPVRATHFLVNFIGIGWVLNGYVSVEIFNLVKIKKPEWLSKSTTAVERVLTKAVEILGKSPNKALTHSVSGDLVDIAALGTGGFIVLPLQKIYAAHRVRISDTVEKGVEKIKSLFGNTYRKNQDENSKSDDKAIEKIESKESFSHWAASRVVAFAAGCGAYLFLKYITKDSFTKLNKSVIKFVEKNFPKFLVPEKNKTEYWVAEQVATVTGVSTLAATKTALDKLFPPKSSKQFSSSIKAEGNKKTITDNSTKSFRERADMKSTEQGLSPL